VRFGMKTKRFLEGTPSPKDARSIGLLTRCKPLGTPNTLLSALLLSALSLPAFLEFPLCSLISTSHIDGAAHFFIPRCGGTGGMRLCLWKMENACGRSLPLGRAHLFVHISMYCWPFHRIPPFDDASSLVPFFLMLPQHSAGRVGSPANI